MKLTQNEVIAWIQNPDVISGMELLHRIKPMHKSISLVAIKAKLCYATNLPINYTPTPNQLPVNSEQLTGNSEQLTGNSEQLQVNSDQKSEIKNLKSKIIDQKSEITNPQIEQIIKEHAHLVQLRSQLHDERLSLGHDNQPAIVKKRKILTESIHQHSERIEALFAAKELYFTKNIMPDMEALFPSTTPNPKPITPNPKPTTRNPKPGTRNKKPAPSNK
jgi:hypothetical protein